MSSRWLNVAGSPVRLDGIDASVLTAAINADSPQLLWTFDEASGTTVTDHSGNSRAGTVSGTVARGALPLIGHQKSTCLHAGEVTIADAAWMDVTPDMSAEIVFMLSRTPTSVPVLPLSRYDAGGMMWHIYVNTSGGVGAAVRNASNAYQDTSTTPPLPLGVPVHVVMTRTTSALVLYVNGTSVATGTPSGAMRTGTSAVIVNKTVAATWERGVLHVAAAAVYDTALSAGRVLAHAQAAGLA